MGVGGGATNGKKSCQSSIRINSDSHIIHGYEIIDRSIRVLRFGMVGRDTLGAGRSWGRELGSHRFTRLWKVGVERWWVK